MHFHLDADIHSTLCAYVNTQALLSLAPLAKEVHVPSQTTLCVYQDRVLLIVLHNTFALYRLTQAGQALKQQLTQVYYCSSRSYLKSLLFG